jgi:serine/threonine-protein kinase RIO1
MYHDCRLVHGDLSEYNMLYHEGEVYFIDVSQSVELDHPHALDFLRKDCQNVNDFFSKKVRRARCPYARTKLTGAACVSGRGSNRTATNIRLRDGCAVWAGCRRGGDTSAGLSGGWRRR